MDIPAPRHQAFKTQLSSPEKYMSTSPNKRKFGNAREDDDFLKVLDGWGVKDQEVQSKKIWIHFINIFDIDANTAWMTIRESFLNLFGLCGEITDFYLPMRFSAQNCFCFIEYKNNDSAKDAVSLYEYFKQNEIQNHPTFQRIPSDTAPFVIQLSKRISKVEFATERGLVYSERIKKHKGSRSSSATVIASMDTNNNNNNSMDEDSATAQFTPPSTPPKGFYSTSPINSDSPPSGGFITVVQLSELENFGEDVTHFQVPNADPQISNNTNPAKYSFL